MFTIYTDRSRAEVECPRRRYLQYEYMNMGIVPARINTDLTIGVCVHEGLSQVMGIARDHDRAPTLEELDWIVSEVKAQYRSTVTAFELDLEPSEDILWVVGETEGMIEALVRIWTLYRLPEILKEYRILEVEREDVLRVAKMRIGPDGVLRRLDHHVDWAALNDELIALGDSIDAVNQGDLVWQSRADFLAEHRETQDKMLGSFKTAKQWGKREDRKHKHDMQGLSEMAAVEERLGEKLMGTLVEYLLKGYKKENPEGSGRYVWYSLLVRGWRMRGVTPAHDKYAWKWEWEDDFGNKTRLKKEHGGAVRGGPGWEPFYPWADGEMGIRAWLELLASGRACPGLKEGYDKSPFEDCLIHPYPYSRNSDDLQDWFEEIYWQETDIASHAREVEEIRARGNPKEYRAVLNKYFPRHRHACDYPTSCPYTQVCWEGRGIEEQNPVETGVYRWREPHHEPERKALRGE